MRIGAVLFAIPMVLRPVGNELRPGASWEPRTAAGLPAVVAGIPSVNTASVGTDGTAFGWISDGAQGGDGIGYWSPETGIVKVNGGDLDPEVTKFFSRVLVFDSFVIVGAGGMTSTLRSSATIVDTRSGAVVELTPRNPEQYDMVTASRGGTFALVLWAGAGCGPKDSDRAVGLLRSGALAPLRC